MISKRFEVRLKNEIAELRRKAGFFLAVLFVLTMLVGFTTHVVVTATDLTIERRVASFFLLCTLLCSYIAFWYVSIRGHNNSRFNVFKHWWAYLRKPILVTIEFDTTDEYKRALYELLDSYGTNIYLPDPSKITHRKWVLIALFRSQKQAVEARLTI